MVKLVTGSNSKKKLGNFAKKESHLKMGKAKSTKVFPLLTKME